MPEGGGEALVGVRVDLRERDLALALGDRLLEHRRELAARAAPRGPEVDDDRQLARALDDVLLEGGLGGVEDHASRLPSVAEFTVERDGVTLAGEEAGEGIPVVAAARADRDAPLRRDGLPRARARRAPRGRLRRARPRRARRRRRPVAYGYETLAADLLARARRPRDRPRGAGRRLDGGAHARRASRSTTATASPGSCSSRRPSRPRATTTGPRALGRAGGRAAERRRRGLRRGLRRAAACPSAGARRSIKVLRQRLSAHEHPEAVADALDAVPRSRAFEAWDELAELDAADDRRRQPRRGRPRPPVRGRRALREAIPGAELRSEEPGSSPLAWQGGQLSKVIAELGRARAPPSGRAAPSAPSAAARTRPPSRGRR